MSEAARPGGTYQTLDEQRERLSPAEERFERARQTIGLFLGPVVFLILYFIPLPLEPAQQALAAIFAFVIVYWLTEPIPIPVTAVLGIAACVLFGVAGAEAVFGAFSSDTIFLFIGAFIIAQAMMTHGLDRRFAFRVLSIPGVSNSTYGVIIAFGAIAATISAFISNTATTAMLLPIGLGIMAALGGLVSEQAEGERDPSRLRFGTALMLMIAYGASVGGLITPIGSPPNLIGIGFIEDQTGTTISFFEWTVTALPIVILMFLALCVILILLNRPEVRRISGADEYIAEERGSLGGFSAGERNTLIAFGLAVTLWILPGIVNLIAGEKSAPATFLKDHLNEGVVAILAAALLFILPVNWAERRFTMTWNGAGITLGKLLSDTGLAKTIGGGVTSALGLTSLLGITLLATVVAILISETTSNTASVGIVVPIVIPIANAAGVEPLIPALAAIFGSSYGFMLPVSTPPNAIVYGSGMIPITKMVRSGVVFDVIGAVLIVAGITIMVQLIGLA